MINWRPEGDAHEERSPNRMQCIQCTQLLCQASALTHRSPRPLHSMQAFIYHPLCSHGSHCKLGTNSLSPAASPSTQQVLRQHPQRHGPAIGNEERHLNNACMGANACSRHGSSQLLGTWLPIPHVPALAAPRVRSVFACLLQRRQPRSAVCLLCAAAHSISIGPSMRVHAPGQATAG